MLKKVAVNILVFALLMTLISFAAGLWFEWGHKGPSIIEEVSEAYIEPDKLLGFRGKANIKTISTKSVGESIIYRAEYEFDEFGRRISPPVGRVEKKSYMVFLGDSNSFGEGVASYKTLPFLMEGRHPSYRSYNYSFRGWGPGNILALTGSDRLKKEIPQEQGLVFYMYWVGLEERLIGTTGLFEWSDGWHPYYEMGEGKKLVRNGTFSSARPVYTWAQKRLARSNLNKIFKIDYPNPFNDPYYEMLCQSFVQIKENVEKNMSQPHFWVVLWRNLGGYGEVAMIRNCLRNKGINYFDMTHTEPPDKSFDIHALDRHLNGKGHDYYATELSRRLLARGLIRL